MKILIFEQYGYLLSMRNGGDRTGGVAANARQFHEFIPGFGQLRGGTVLLRFHSQSMQIASTAVITCLR